MEWIEKMKAGSRKATASMTHENMALLEEVAAKFQTKNISELLVILCNQSKLNNDEELEKTKSDLLICLEANKELNQQRTEFAEEYEAEKRQSKDFERLLDEAKKQSLDFEVAYKKEKEKNETTASLLQLAQVRMDEQQGTIDSFKTWLQKERNRISSWWHSAPPL